MTTTLAVQRALLARGYDLGPALDDGVLGRATIAAVAAFQRAEKLAVQFPGTIGAKTLAALGLATPKMIEPSWIVEARRFLGLHEVRDAKRLDAAMRMDVSQIPWCGAFVGMVIGAVLPTERLPANPLGARNWQSFGRSVPTPQIGVIAPFWRGSKTGWQGHVGFVVGHDRTHLHILGANQSDAVTVARIAKTRLLDLRWPLNAPPPPEALLATSTIQAAITTNEA